MPTTIRYTLYTLVVDEYFNTHYENFDIIDEGVYCMNLRTKRGITDSLTLGKLNLDLTAFAINLVEGLIMGH
jgi:hypothetical protein